VRWRGTTAAAEKEKTTSKVVIDKIFTLLTFVMGLQEHGLPYDCPVICLYIHPSPSQLTARR